MGKAGRGIARRAQAARQDREHGRLRRSVAQPAAGVLPAREPETSPAERAACAPCARRSRLPRRREGRGKLARAILRHAFSRCRDDGRDAEAARLGQHSGLASDARRKPCGGTRLQANPEAGRAVKGLLWLLVLSALAVALSLAMRGHGAYALFVLHPWRAEISLNLLAILLIVVLAGAYFLLRVVWHALRLPSHVRAFRERRRAEKGRSAALGAIQALFEGQFVRAEKLASGAAELGAAPGLASLLAARAARYCRARPPIGKASPGIGRTRRVPSVCVPRSRPPPRALSSGSGIVAGPTGSSRKRSSATGTARSRCSMENAPMRTRSSGSSGPNGG